MPARKTLEQVGTEEWWESLVARVSFDMLIGTSVSWFVLGLIYM